jgi:hypothetical protein
MIIKIYDGRMVEIIINSAVKPISADMLVRVMTLSGITAAKIIRIQTAKEIPPPRFDQEGGGQSTP